MSSYSNIDFDHQIYTLASVHHVKEYHPRPPCCDKYSKQKLELLDDIALLLVKDPGDVVAVSMEIHPSKAVFFYAKDRPCDASVTSYLDKIVNVIRQNEPNDVTYDMLSVVLAECAAKFIARIRKCQKVLEECEDMFGAAPVSDPRNRFPNDLIITDGHTALDFCNDIKSFDTEASVINSHLKRSVRISVVAGLLGIRKYSFPNPAVDRRIQKLGTYFRAVMWIEKLLDHPTYRSLVRNIEFKEIKPSVPRTFQITRDTTCFVLNEIAPKLSPEIMPTELPPRYPKLRLHDTDGSMITATCHCELSVAIHAANSMHESKTIAIGVSKKICWLCQCYLKIFSRIKKVCILVSGYQGRIHAGWNVPPDTPDELEKGMRQLVHNELILVRGNIIKQRQDEQDEQDEQEFNSTFYLEKIQRVSERLRLLRDAKNSRSLHRAMELV